MAHENVRNYEVQGGSTWVVTGELEIASSGLMTIQSGGVLDVESGGDIDIQSGANIDVEAGGYIAVSSGGQIAIPYTASSSADAPIPNFGICTIRGGAAAGDTRLVAAPTRAGLELNLVANSSTTIGINVVVASATSKVDIVIRSTGNQESVWEIIGSTQNAKFISANTSEWYVIGPITGTLSTDGST